MVGLDFAAALRRGRHADPGTIPDILEELATGIDGRDLVLYLVDFGQTTLEPFPHRSTRASLPSTEPVATSMAGRAFVDQQVVTAERGDEFRAWVPVVEGSDRTGVLALTLRSDGPSVLAACEDLGLLAGYLIAAHARYTDVYNLYRRRRAMTLAASMQWDLLPPLVSRTDTVAIAGLVEPAYEVGGDCFDYASNGNVFDFAVIDAMGHGLRSAAVAALAMGAYRHDRRQATPLDAMHLALAATIQSEYDGDTFATGLLARLETSSGLLSFTNAGHPLPILVRGGRVIGELACPPTPPWGLLEGAPTIASEQLEPGDAVLVYTDGVIEARTPDGEEFGLERLIDVVHSTASDVLPPEEVVRLLVRSVIEHQNADLADDATVVLLQWRWRAH